MKNIKLKSNKEFIFREEFFGGYLFSPISSLTIELDKEAFYLLSVLKDENTIPNIKNRLEKYFNKKYKISAIIKMLHVFNNLNILYKHKQINRFSNIKFPGIKYLSAPESVHFLITSRCNYNCSSCYIQKNEKELPLKKIFKIIDELSELKVFQLAIGGGEPFLRKDTVDIIKYTRQKNIIPNITTNGSTLTMKLINKIKKYIGQLQISANDFSSINNVNFFNNLLLLKSENIRFGINLIVTKNVIKNLNSIIKKLSFYNPSNINFIRPKLVSLNIKWFNENNPILEEYKRFNNKLSILSERYSNIHFTLDCALTFLLKDIPFNRLKFNRINGCTAGKRIITIDSNGDIYPCCFLKIGFKAGNIKKQSLKNIWQKSEKLKLFRDNSFIKDFQLKISKNRS